MAVAVFSSLSPRSAHGYWEYVLFLKVNKYVFVSFYSLCNVGFAQYFSIIGSIF